MSSVFSALHESLQQVLAQRFEWTELREVQERTFASVSSGNDVLVIAPTAGGKSEAALIPVIDDILKNGRPGVTCLYLSPLKALINDQEERFSAFCVPTSLSVMKWHGDVAKGDRSWKDGEPPHFLMITPESLEVLLQDTTLSADLRQVRYIIVDELHAFVESERGVHLRVLLSRMDRIAGRAVQRVGLSATTGNPGEVLRWLSESRHGHEVIVAPAIPQEKHFRFIIEPEESRRTEALVRIVSGRKALVFVNSRSGAEEMVRSLSGRVRNLHVHHSSLSPETRRSAEEAFSSGDGACIICTSTLELGIDIGDLDVVVQVGPPDSVSSFLQRMGRSGRRGRPANVAWVLAGPCELLCSIAVIECAMNGEVEDLVPQKRPYNVLLQQVFLYLHNHPRVSRRKIRSDMLSYPVFSGITPATLDQLIGYLGSSGYIATDGEMVMPGTEAEREFGRSNWRDLYSVITGGGEYRAVTPEGDVVGNLDARFVNSHDAGEISLGGRTWTMIKCDEGHNLVVVVPSGSETSRTFWTGSGEGGLTSLVCRKVQQILARRDSVLPLGADERDALQKTLVKIPEAIDQAGLHVIGKRDPGRPGVLIYSMNGSRFNRVLAFVLRKRLGGKARVRYNDFIVRITGAGSTGATERIVDELRTIRTLDRHEIGVLLPLPPPDNWKFGRLLPAPMFCELVWSDHYHIGEFMAGMEEMAIKTLQVPETGGIHGEEDHFL